MSFREIRINQFGDWDSWESEFKNDAVCFRGTDFSHSLRIARR